MIEWFSQWSKNIVIAVIIATLIEMILPNNSSKKYIKIVVGIFIVYTIIYPVINWLSDGKYNEIGNIENYVEVSSNCVVSNNDFISKTDSSIRAIYSKNLQNDIETKLKEQGYIASYVNVKIAQDDSYNIEKIDIKITEKIEQKSNQKQAKTIVDNVKMVIVKLDDKNCDESVINENDKNTIKKFIEENYGVQKCNIVILI